jgi:hypothetical protein
MYAYLLEADAWTGAAVETQHLATHTVVTSPTETPANTIYDGRLTDAGSIERSLFSGGVMAQGSSTSYGYVEIANADGALDAWWGYGFDGRAFSMRALGARGIPVGGAPIVFRGTLSGIDSSNAATTIRLPIRDRLSELAIPLLTARYAGTTTGTGLGIEGNADLTGQIKPRVFGQVINVSGKLVNSFDLLWQFSSDAVASIAVYDGGAPLTPAGDYPTLPNLMAATVAGGSYATCKALGVARLGGSPIFEVTADVADAADCSASAVAGRILDTAGVSSSDRDAATFAALAAANTAPVGIYIDGDTTALDAADQVLGSISARLVPTTLGLFRAVRLVAPASPIGELTLADLAQGSGFSFGAGPDQPGVPAWSVALNYGRVWTTLAAGQTAGSVSLARRTYLGSATRQAVASASSVRTAHPLAAQVTVDTLLANQADAQAEADRLLALYSVRRDRLSWPLAADSAPYEIGQVVSVRLSRFGYGAGKPMLVIGRRDDFSKRTVTLDLWG